MEEQIRKYIEEKIVYSKSRLKEWNNCDIYHRYQVGYWSGSIVALEILLDDLENLKK